MQGLSLLYLEYIKGVSQVDIRYILGISQIYLRHFSGISQVYLRYVFLKLILGIFLGPYKACFRNVLDIYQAYIEKREVSVYWCHTLGSNQIESES